jgi:hypothetical protein
MYKVTFKNLSAMGILHGCPDEEYTFEVQASSSFEAMQAGIAAMRKESGVHHPDCYYDVVVKEWIMCVCGSMLQADDCHNRNHPLLTDKDGRDYCG